MKKFGLVFLSAICFFTFALVTNAASKCDYSELAEINQEAAGVKVSYEESFELLEKGEIGVADLEDGATPPDLYTRYFKVNITNVTENLYVKIYNSVDNTTKIFSSSDAVNGVVSYRWDDIADIANLTVRVYTSSKTNCSNEEVLVQQVTLPKYNYYSETSYCTSNPDDSICSLYVTKEVTKEEFDAKVAKENKEKIKEAEEEQKVTNKIKRYVKKNKKRFIIGGSIIIVLGVATTVVVIVKRKRSRLI